MTKTSKKDIVLATIKQGNVAGFSCMEFLEDAIRLVKKQGVKLCDEQQLRSAFASLNEKKYLSFLLDETDGSEVWSIFEVFPKPNEFGGPDLTGKKWIGWTRI